MLFLHALPDNWILFSQGNKKYLTQVPGYTHGTKSHISISVDNNVLSYEI